jgi:hypothetical protein
LTVSRRTKSPMAERSFPGLADLIRDIEAEAKQQPDPLSVLVALLRLVVASDADPYLFTGALVEGIAANIANKIPPERQGDVAIEAVRLLRDRLHNYGAI